MLEQVLNKYLRVDFGECVPMERAKNQIYWAKPPFQRERIGIGIQPL